MRVRDRVAIAIEAHVRRLARYDRAHYFCFEGMRREREQSRLFFGEDLGHRPIALLGMRTLVRGLIAPAPKLGQVRDAVFATHEFFDSRDVVQVKYEMIRRVEVEAQPVAPTAAAFHFSRPSFYHAQRAFQERGLAGLLPKKRGPRSGHKLTAEILAFLQDLRASDASLRPTELANVSRSDSPPACIRARSSGRSRGRKKNAAGHVPAIDRRRDRRAAQCHSRLRGPAAGGARGQPWRSRLGPRVIHAPRNGGVDAGLVVLCGTSITDAWCRARVSARAAGGSAR